MIVLQIEDALLPIAAAEAEAGKQSGSPELIFFTAKSEKGIPSQVRNVCNLKRTTDAPQVGIDSLIFCRCFVSCHGEAFGRL